MSLSDETRDLTDKREAVFHRLGEKLEKLIHHVRKIALAEAILEIQRKLDAAERRIAELAQSEPDLSLYGKGEPKSLEELKASHDRLVGGTAEDFRRFDPALGAPSPACSCPPNSTLIEKSCSMHGGWFPQGDCNCPPEWTAQCKSSACPRHRTKNTRDWL